MKFPRYKEREACAVDFTLVAGAISFRFSPYIHSMFDLPPNSRYLLLPDEAYTTKMPFNEFVGFVKFSAMENNLDGLDDLLVIELPEGVFIRAANPGWCQTLTNHAEAEKKELPIEIIGSRKWTELTRRYRAPLQSFGNERLAMWKVGF